MMMNRMMMMMITIIRLVIYCDTKMQLCGGCIICFGELLQLLTLDEYLIKRWIKEIFDTCECGMLSAPSYLFLSDTCWGIIHFRNSFTEVNFSISFLCIVSFPICFFEQMFHLLIVFISIHLEAFYRLGSYSCIKDYFAKARKRVQILQDIN